MTEPIREGAVLEGLPVFPLPNVVFFPKTMLPLHVFEPRYLAMIRDCLEGDGRLGVVRLETGWETDYEGTPPISTIFGLGEIVRHEQDDDGKYNIYLRGLSRVRVLEEEDSDDLYRRVRAEVLGETRGVSDGQLATVRQLFATAIARMREPDLRSAAVLFESDLPPGLLLDAIATAAPLAPTIKQALLEECDESARATKLTEALVSLALPG